MADSLCTPPDISIPNPADILAALVKALEALGFQIPAIPSIPIPDHIFCPLD